MSNGKCDATFVGKKDNEVIRCNRDDSRHVVHRDSNGTKVVKAPGGAIVSKSGK